MEHISVLCLPHIYSASVCGIQQLHHPLTLITLITNWKDMVMVLVLSVVDVVAQVVEAVLMENVAKMAAAVMEEVMVAHQFAMVMVPLLFQTGNKYRLNDGRCTTLHKKGRCRVFQMNTTCMCSIFHM